MHLKNLCQQAFVNLNAAKLRSFLAVLGILVGTAAVVALISSGRLATEKALEQFKTLGTDLLSIAVYPKDHKNTSHDTGNPLSLEFWRGLPQTVPYIRQIAPYGLAFQTMSYQGKNLMGSIIAADESLANIVHIELKEGRFVSFLDSYEHFCVIGDKIAKQILEESGDSPLHKNIRVGQILYTVIGIAKPWKENAFFNDDINQAIIVPIKGLSLVNSDDKINNAVVLLKAKTPLDSVIHTIEQLIHVKAPALGIFARSPKHIIASLESQTEIFSWLLLVIGSISLIVGGIGIMNVMLVSVSERKKEIGIRKAVGAKNREIQTLFLMESVMLSLSGGFLGVVLGLLVTRILAYFCNWDFVIQIAPPVAGFSVSIITGIFFGFYPALRAARMDAVVSLRSE